MVRALGIGDGDHTRFLEEVRLNEGPLDRAIARKVQSHHLSEARGVVVAHRLGVAERLEQRIGREDRVGELVELISGTALDGRRLGSPLR